MNIFIFFLFGLNVIFCKNNSFNFIEEEFKKFLIKYNKTYSIKEEYLKRLNLFNSSFYRIIKHNNNNNDSFELGINYFSDLTEEEINQYKFKERNIIFPNASLAIEYNDNDIDKEKINIPESYDYYRENNMINEIKTQGHCGSCVVFSIVSLIETYYARKKQIKDKKKLKKFSEQQIMDCLYNGKKNICIDWTSEEDVLEYIIKNGLMESFYYPYVSGEQSEVIFNCKYKKNLVNKISKIPGYKKIIKPKINNIKKYIIKYGPVSTGIHACRIVFEYTNGIMSFSKYQCSPEKMDHSVNIVGWGKDKKTSKNYWIIRNSWSKDWGIQGYGYVEMGKNIIGIENEIYFIYSNQFNIWEINIYKIIFFISIIALLIFLIYKIIKC